ncbi:hypothetical protein vseg_012296 [Gypsophila vaccaria]
MAEESYVVKDALQVTHGTNGDNGVNLAGKIVYRKKFRLWKKKKVASFNSTFVLNVTPQLNGGGEGIAFVLCKDFEVPDNSEGQWLGIVNARTNGSSKSSIVAVEFDTRKSFPEDLDSNHVGLNINSVYSEKQVSLNASDIVIGSGNDFTAMILYNGSTNLMDVYVFKGNHTGGFNSTTKPIISMSVNLRQYLPSDVYVGFSASTGSSTELNCVKAWFFKGSDLGRQTRFWVWIVVAVVIDVIVVLILGFGYLYLRKKQKWVDPPGSESTIQGIETGLGPKKIKLMDLKTATGNFNTKNELGRGRYGVVYKGFLDGIEVAVRRITYRLREKQTLISKVASIGSIHHKNLVRLIGWCHEHDELILVYEYMPNRSLAYYIRKNNAVVLTWERRHNIICGVAQALDYLHNECSKRVLHRDIKPCNIMIDSKFNACLRDYGLARMFQRSHSTIEIAGTPGYMAPEIFHTGRATSETDVYAFGVLALVVACGKKAVFEINNDEYRNNIVDWVWELYSLDLIDDAVDPNLKGKFRKGQAECMLLLGLACCHPNPYMRPSMRIALQVLMGKAFPPLIPCHKPTFMWPAASPSLTREDSLSARMLMPCSTISGR